MILSQEGQGIPISGQVSLFNSGAHSQAKPVARFLGAEMDH